MSTQPVVSWAGPVEQAHQAIVRGSDLLACKRWAEGITEIQRARNSLDIAMAFILEREGERR